MFSQAVAADRRDDTHAWLVREVVYPTDPFCLTGGGG